MTPADFIPLCVIGSAAPIEPVPVSPLRASINYRKGEVR